MAKDLTLIKARYEGQAEGLLRAEQYLRKRAQDSFMDHRDDEARALRDSAREVVLMRADVANQLDVAEMEHPSGI